mgnify:CR=1 FL=1
MGDPTPTEPTEPTTDDKDSEGTKAQGGREIIPLAAAAFLGALAGAVIGSAIS